MENSHAPFQTERMLRAGVMSGYAQEAAAQNTAVRNGNNQKIGGVAAQNYSDMYPLLRAEVPKEKFMHVMNFDPLLRDENGAEEDNSADDVMEEGRIPSTIESSMDLIEQHQAVEQTRLLQRFKELRQWQFKQQEVLMMQQQQQLQMLRKEQNRVQGAISKQRQTHWGGEQQNGTVSDLLPSLMQTPPQRGQKGKFVKTPEQISEFASRDQQFKGQLPMPVIYAPLLQDMEEDDEIKTNPDLFSDVGSNIGTDEGVGQLAAMEPRDQNPLMLAQLQYQANQMQNLRTAQQMFDRSPFPQPNFSEAGSDSGTQSSLSADMETHSRQLIENDEASDDMEGEDTDASPENRTSWSEFSQKKSEMQDERPIKPGVGGRKTFEELLEEQLQIENEKLLNNGQATTGQKREFLKKGQGTSRFDVEPKQRSKFKAKKSGSSTSIPSQSKTNSKATQKVSPKSLSLQRPGNKPTQGMKSSGSSQSNFTSAALAQTRVSTQAPVAVRDMKDKAQQMATESPSILKADPIPDDDSFVEKLKKREKNAQLEKAELEEFEMLEDYADNMSFSSNSSLVVRFLQKGRTDLNSRPRQPLVKVDEVINDDKIVKPTRPGSSCLKPEPVEKETCDEENDDTLEDISTETESSDSESESESASESESSDEDDVVKIQSLKVQKNEDSDFHFSNRTSDKHKCDSNENFNHSIGLKSPSKIMTRKVAGKDQDLIGGDTRLSFQNVVSNSGLQHQADALTASLNASSFAPTLKAPIVISRQVLQHQSAPNEMLRDSSDFRIKSSELINDDGNKNETKNQKTSPSNLDIVTDIRKSTEDKHDSEQVVDEEDDDDDDDEFVFDDEDEWGDTTLKNTNKDANQLLPGEDSSNREKKQNEAANVQMKDIDGTPPTSRLVSRLFPQLRTQQEKKQQQEQQKLQTVTQTSAGDGVQSKILRDKLAELEREIERFRNENANLERLRKEREEGVLKLKKEIVHFEKEKQLELQRIQEYRTEEMKKLRHEKKVFDKYQKTARALPDKKEREEIEMLKNQLTELQEEMRRKESRWTSSNSRMRSKLEQVEQENLELQEEIKMMEKKRLEWLQKEQASKNNEPKNPMRSSTPTLDFNESISSHELAGQRESVDVMIGLSPVTAVQSKSQPCLKPTQSHHSIRPSQSAHQLVSKAAGQSKHKLQAKRGTGAKTAKSAHPVKSSQSSNSAGPPVSSRSSKQGSQLDRKNLLRMSLTEDVPRQLATTAVPQDVSIYSDTGNDNHPTEELPRKQASRVPLEGSAIDKGNNGYEEIQHSDGKVERIYSNGAREILFSNGTRKEISSDGQSIIVSFFNGDMKQIMADQRVIYYYADAQTTHINHPDGLEILHFPNDQIEKHYPDGTNEITFPDQTIKYLFPNGSEESIFPDSTIIRVDKNGDKTMEFPNGQREIHTQEYKKREYPDGTVKTVYPDGRQETRYSNGRLRVKDKDGNVVVDRHC